ncbi:hypothetical protein [Cellulosilyticum ruminicola]|uniref:hypothetical protein n=1 Tax=Cellulosilyticum ruminicola TaxID=425254 RepID=UPI0006D0B283|nr:hypothetical protein [Cellulosilyticum ruminicola]
MRIVNLTPSRSWYSDIELIKVEGESIFYAVQVKEKKKYFYEVRKRDISEKENKIIWRYKLDEDTFYMQRSYIYGNELILFKLNLRGQLGVVTLEKATGKLIKAINIQIGEIEAEQIIAINERYFFVSGENKKEEDVFYLCDVEEGISYEVTNTRLAHGLVVIHGLTRCIPCFTHGGEDWVVFNECYMEDYEYEEIYDIVEAKKLNANKVQETEGLYVISLNQLVEGVKQKAEIIPFKEIKKHWCDGWVRYLGIKDGHIYYREKDFKTQIETVYAIDINKLEEKSVCEIDHKVLQGVLRYDVNQIYEDVKVNGKRIIKGHYGLDGEVEIPANKYLTFGAYIESQYVVTSWWWENESNGIYMYKEFVGIQDQKEPNGGEMTIYEGQYYVQDNTVLIY